jgi:hypothetical protein
MRFNISSTDTYARAAHTHTKEYCGGHDLNTGHSGIGEKCGKEIMRDKSFIDNYLSVVVERWCVKW